MIVEKIHKRDNLEKEIHEKVKKSLFWKILKEQLVKSNIPVFVSEPENRIGVVCYRGSGHAIRLEKIIIPLCYHYLPKEEQDKLVRLSVRIEWLVKSEEDLDSEREASFSFIDISEDLLFTESKQKIIGWIRKERNKRIEERKKEDIEILKKLLKRYDMEIPKSLLNEKRKKVNRKKSLH